MRVTAGRAGIVLLLAMAAGACRERPSPATPAPTAEGAAVSAQLALETTDPTGVLATVRLVPGVGMPRLGSVTAAVAFDTARLAFTAEDAPPAGRVGAVHLDGDRVRIALAAPAGLDTDAVRLRFTRRHAGNATGALRLDVSEVHTTDGADARSRLVVLPVRVTQ